MLCLVLRPVLRFSPRENINTDFVLTVNKNKIISEAERGGKNFGISTVLGSWALHYKSWEKIKFAPTLIVKYEDLIKAI